jgi:hypothetical protein
VLVVARRREWLRDAPLAYEIWRRNRMAVRITPKSNCRRGFVELPAGRFVPAGDTFEEHPIVLEVQQRIVAVQSTEHLPHKS